MENRDANPYATPGVFAKAQAHYSKAHGDHSNLRRLFAVSLLVLMVLGILAMTRGPILSDGVLFWAPMLVFAVMFWLISHFRNARSVATGCVYGIAGSIFGHVIWFVIYATIAGLPSLTNLFSLLQISLTFATLFGGVFGIVLTFGFRPNPLPDQTSGIAG